MEQLVAEANAQSTLSSIRTPGPPQNPTSVNAGASSSGTQQPPQNPNFSNGRYVEIDLAFPMSFGGQIARHLVAWKSITKDPWVLKTVSEGLLLDFVSEPYQSNIPGNAAMNSTQWQLCDAEVSSLIEKGAIIESSNPCFISGIFLIPRKTGGFRPIINLKGLNQFISYNHFKLEGIPTVKSTIREGDWLAKIDLKDAYLTVPIAPSHRKFLCFRWGRRTFEFVSLPFGLSSAPWVFTKFLRPLDSFLRRQGIRIVIYLDDILIMATTKDKARAAVRIVKACIESLGFVVSVDKSVLDPCQSLEYLGLFIRSIPMTFSLIEKKISDISKMCNTVLKAHQISLRDVAFILGNFNWATHAVRFAQAHSRALQALYNSELKLAGGNLQRKIILTPDARDDLSWWTSRADFQSGKSILSSSPSLTIFTDASLSGWGPFVKI